MVSLHARLYVLSVCPNNVDDEDSEARAAFNSSVDAAVLTLLRKSSAQETHVITEIVRSVLLCCVAVLLHRACIMKCMYPLNTAAAGDMHCYRSDDASRQW